MREAETCKNQGNVLLSLGRMDEAEYSYRKALELQPDFGEAYNNLGNVLRLTNRLEESVHAFQKSVELLPDRVEVLVNYGNALMDSGCYQEAEVVYRKALVLSPDCAPACNGRGNALLALDRWQAAEKSYLKALSLKPDFGEVYSGLGNVLRKQKKFKDAERAYRKAIAIKEDDVTAKYNLSMLKLLLGEYEEGFELYEYRFEGADRKIYENSVITYIHKQVSGFDIWHGEPLRNLTLFVVSEQGFGDNLMMLRYFPMIKQSGCKRLVFYCHQPLKRLVQSMSCVDEVLVEEGEMPFGLYCSIMSLPHLFGTSLSSVPCSVPYFYPPEEMKQKWRTNFAGMTGKKVGLVWAGGKMLKSDKLRSIPLVSFSSIIKLKGIDWVSLQKGEEAVTQMHELGWDLFDRMDECEDFLDTAALIAELDLVISVDTSIVHLAGALGKPVWLLNRYECEWRWMLERSDSPWYSSMTIFTQTEYGNWDSVMDKVGLELLKMLAC